MPVIPLDGQTLATPRSPSERENPAAANTRDSRPPAIRLGPEDDPRVLTSWLPGLELVILLFPRFTDGRPFSQARLLRGPLQFGGELRASGDVRRDQLEFLHRCGFSSLEVAEDEWNAARQGMTTPVRGHPRLQDPCAPTVAGPGDSGSHILPR